jgi:hypothetical protein
MIPDNPQDFSRNSESDQVAFAIFAAGFCLHLPAPRSNDINSV